MTECHRLWPVSDGNVIYNNYVVEYDKWIIWDGIP